MDKDTKATLISEIQDLPEGSRYVFVAQEPEEKEDAQTITAVGCSLVELGGMFCSALHSSFIEAGVMPRAGRDYMVELCKLIRRTCAEASAEVLANLSAEEREEELLGMMQELLGDTKEGEKDDEN